MNSFVTDQNINYMQTTIYFISCTIMRTPEKIYSQKINITPRHKFELGRLRHRSPGWLGLPRRLGHFWTPWGGHFRRLPLLSLSIIHTRSAHILLLLFVAHGSPFFCAFTSDLHHGHVAMVLAIIAQKVQERISGYASWPVGLSLISWIHFPSCVLSIYFSLTNPKWRLRFFTGVTLKV